MVCVLIYIMSDCRFIYITVYPFHYSFVHIFYMCIQINLSMNKLIENSSNEQSNKIIVLQKLRNGRVMRLGERR